MITNLGSFSDEDDLANHGIDKSDSDLKSQSTYSNATGADGLGWKFGNDKDNPWVWDAFDDYYYPTLYWQTVEPLVKIAANKTTLAEVAKPQSG
ncbi:MAG: hypothetical protein LBP89_08210 [Helicobacteraceae bacterium]|jgi:hypothetical protein|nr:hypothetical protein [Helicobacteraceae bacterium]